MNSLNSLLSLPPNAIGFPPLLSSTTPTTHQPLPLPDWDHIPLIPGVIKIQTGFDPRLPSNDQLKFSKEKTAAATEERWRFTQEQRQLAEAAFVPKDFQDFKTKVGIFYFVSLVVVDGKPLIAYYSSCQRQAIQQ